MRSAGGRKPTSAHGDSSLVDGHARLVGVRYPQIGPGEDAAWRAAAIAERCRRPRGRAGVHAPTACASNGEALRRCAPFGEHAVAAAGPSGTKPATAESRRSLTWAGAASGDFSRLDIPAPAGLRRRPCGQAHARRTASGAAMCTVGSTKPAAAEGGRSLTWLGVAPRRTSVSLTVLPSAQFQRNQLTTTSPSSARAIGVGAWGFTTSFGLRCRMAGR
jgi:hypothetical protein